MPFRIDCSQLLECQARRICLIKPSALGDVVQTLPLLPVLRRRFPGAGISWIIKRGLADLLAGHPDLDEVIPFDRRGPLRGFVRLLRDLRARRFDLVLDLQGLFRSALMTAATGAPLRVGLESAREGAQLMCNIILLDSGRDVPGHARYWRVAEALGLSDPLRRALVPVTEADRAWARHALNGLPRPILAVHAGAGWPTKRWPAEKFAAVAARFPGAFVTIGSADERALAERVIASSGGAPARARCLAGATTTRRLAALLEAVDLVLSNDSGPMHLAAAMGTPVIGVFTCTSPYLSGPAGDHHELVATAVGCAASYCKRCPNWGRRQLMCLDELPVERVWNAVERSLAEIPAIARSA